MSAANDLVSFLKQQKEKEALRGIDPEVDVKEWKSDVANLVAKIAGWLREASQQGLVNLEEKVVPIQEEPLGELFLQSLRIHAPRGRVVSVQPIARYVVGGEGRVDLLNGPRRVTLVRLKDHNWAIARTEPNQIGYHVDALSEQTFAEALKDLLA